MKVIFFLASLGLGIGFSERQDPKMQSRQELFSEQVQ
jgi:hypothetical protein